MSDILVARQREINTTFADSGVTTLDSLQAKRAALASANAALWARYGDGGTFGQRRDNLFAAIAIEKRGQLEAEGKKVTEPMVEAAVRADSRYRAEFYLNNNAIKDLDEKMFRDNAVIRYLTTEPKV
jgi:hypothetical protein